MNIRLFDIIKEMLTFFRNIIDFSNQEIHFWDKDSTTPILKYGSKCMSLISTTP